MPLPSDNAGMADDDVEMAATDTVCLLASINAVSAKLTAVTQILQNLTIDTSILIGKNNGPPPTDTMSEAGPTTRSRKEREAGKLPRIKKYKTEKIPAQTIKVCALHISKLYISNTRFHFRRASVRNLDGFPRPRPRLQPKINAPLNARVLRLTMRIFTVRIPYILSHWYFSEYVLDGKVTIDFTPTKADATILTQAAYAMEEQQAKAHSKHVVARLLYQHRAELEEIQHSVNFLMRRCSVTLTEIQHLIGLIPFCDNEDVPRSLDEEVELCPAGPSTEAEEGFLST